MGFDEVRDVWKPKTSPARLRKLLGESGVRSARRKYFPLWQTDVVLSGVDTPRSGLYSRFEVADPYEKAVIRAVAPSAVTVNFADPRSPVDQ